MSTPRVLVIACGALARELLAIVELNGLANVSVECLPASLHNRPSEIPELVRERIRRARQDDVVPGTKSSDEMVPGTKSSDAQLVDAGTPDATGKFDEILIGYADCGTGGLLEKVCAEEGVEMLAGAHCYQFFATHERFDQLQDHALGSFYLTDFLARNWERLIWEGLGIARHPELLDMYFGNYTRCVYLEQTDDPKARAAAHECAERLGLELHIEHTGYGELETTLVEFTSKPASSTSPGKTSIPMSTDDADRPEMPAAETPLEGASDAATAETGAEAVEEIREVGDELDQGEMRERQSGRRTNRRRGGRGGATVSTIYWRDIPAQLTARGAAEQSKVLLHARFQHAIDRAAGIAGLTSTDDYVREWRNVLTPLADGDVSAQLDQLCADLEGQFSKDRLESLVANGGIDPDDRPDSD